jgi:hypothetical protein
MPSKRKIAKRELKTARKASMRKPSGESRYGKKRSFLNAHGGTGIDWPDKPWRSGGVEE